MSARAVPDLLVDVLVDAGITHVFGLPGGNTMEFWKALHGREHQIRAIVPRDEQTAACMADLYGKLTGKPGVFCAQGVFAGSIGMFGVIEGFLSHTPMLVMSEMSEVDRFIFHGPMQGATGSYGSVDLPAILGAATKYVAVAHHPREAVMGTQLALKHALAGCPGPTAVLYRSNALKAELPADIFPAIEDTRSYLDVQKTQPPEGAIRAAAEALAGARRPVIVAGNGVRLAQAGTALRQVAQRLGAPVVTSHLGKGTLEETHALAFGTMGYTGTPLANETVANADAVLVVGCRLKPQDTCFGNPRMIDPKRQVVVQVDVDPRHASWTVPAKLALVGDARLTLELLDEQLAPRVDSARSAAQLAAHTALKAARAAHLHPTLGSEAIPLLPQRVVGELNAVVPEDAIVCTDAGNSRHWMGHHFQTKRANSYFGTGGIGGVSWSMAAALAAQIIAPERPAIGVCGDGGFAMQMHVLLSAVQYGAAPVYVVMNNSAFGMTGQAMGERSVGNDLPETDYAAIARACGCHAERVTRPGDVAQALSAALALRRPAVIDVVIDPASNMKRELYSPYATEALAAAATRTY
jgi:acetolactate synthase-1/2/3 large subunit